MISQIGSDFYFTRCRKTDPFSNIFFFYCFSTYCDLLFEGKKKVLRRESKYDEK
jgi:hypothetical protein